MKNDGKTFENVIASIQEAFRDIPSGQILQNVKLEDISGVLREIDVLVKLIVQGTEINIAIECKDHNRNISITQIDGFQSKCADIPMINKKIFISRKGFSKNAKIKAERCGVLLLVLEEVTSESIKNWLRGVSIAGKVNIIRSLSSPAIEFIDNPFDILAESTEIEFNGERIFLRDFMTSFVRENFSQLPYALRSEEMPANRTQIQRVEIKFSKPCPIFCGDNSSKIKTLWFNIEDEFVEIESKTSYDKLILNEISGVNAEALTITSGDNDVMSLVKKSNSDVIDMVVNQIDDSGKKTYIKIGEMSIRSVGEVE